MKRAALPEPLAALLFDLDGTLVDTEGLHFESQNLVLARFGCSMDRADFLRFVGWAEEPFWNTVAREHGLSLPARELAELRTAALLELFVEREVPLLLGARELLEALARRGIPAAVASSSPRRQIEASLREAGLLHLLVALRSGHDDVPLGKPAPDVYLAAAAALGVEASGCIAVEDSSTGLAAARAAGCFVVGVPCPSHPDPGLEAADLVLPSLAALERFLFEEAGAGAAPRA